MLSVLDLNPKLNFGFECLTCVDSVSTDTIMYSKCRPTYSSMLDHPRLCNWLVLQTYCTGLLRRILKSISK